MERIPENDLMDDAEQARAYAEADFSEAHDAFVSHFISRFPEFTKGEVLDLGCGTADVVIRFARALPNIHIIGIDGAEAMLKIGSCDIARKGLSHQIKIKKCHLPDKCLSLDKFDAVISNSLLHHLNNPMTLWNTVARCARQGAPLFIMDLMRPDCTGTAQELVRLHAGEASKILQTDFYNSLLAAYKTDEIKKQLKAVHLDYLTVEAVSDRHLLIWGNKS